MAILTADAFAAMAAHMNDDHADAVAAYARHFAHIDGVAGARIVTMDESGLLLEVDADQTIRTVSIAFDRVVVDTDDARNMLIAMWKTAESATT